MENSILYNYKCGSLPKSAPLAAAYVPMQESAKPAYDSTEALERGTLFPGLDLPFMKYVKSNTPDTPLNEVMSIDFVTDELALYLDTHKDDVEAFEMFQTFLTLSAEAHARYTEKYGAICRKDLRTAESYTWLDKPWPWEYLK